MALKLVGDKAMEEKVLKTSKALETEVRSTIYKYTYIHTYICWHGYNTT